MRLVPWRTLTRCSEVAIVPETLSKPMSVRQIQAEHIGKLVTVEGIGAALRVMQRADGAQSRARRR